MYEAERGNNDQAVESRRRIRRRRKGSTQNCYEYAHNPSESTEENSDKTNIKIPDEHTREIIYY